MNSRRTFMKKFGVGAIAVGAVNSDALAYAANFPSGKNQSTEKADDSQPDKEGVYIVDKGSHRAEDIISALSVIKPVIYQPPSNRWLNLPITVSRLQKEGCELNVVMLGDSIVNDTYRSQWFDLLQARHPKCKIKATAVVRGSTGCWWYKEAGRVKQYVIQLKPDLLIIGGISQKDDTESIREVIRQVRLSQSCDILLMTGAFGKNLNPFDDQTWSFDLPMSSNHYNRKLYNLSNELCTGFLDMGAHWGLYVKNSGNPVEWFKRDEIHANIKGEQILGHILASHLSSPLPKQIDLG